MAQSIPVATLRNNLPSVLKAVDKKQDYLIVTKRGNPISVLVNLDFFEDLLALTSNKYLKSIKEAREDFKKGRVKSMEEVFGSLL